MLIMPSRGDRVYELLFIFCCNCVAIFARFPRYSKVLVQIGDFFINPFYVTPPGKTVANISALFFYHNQARSLAYHAVSTDSVYSQLTRVIDRQTELRSQ